MPLAHRGQLVPGLTRRRHRRCGLRGASLQLVLAGAARPQTPFGVLLLLAQPLLGLDVDGQRGLRLHQVIGQQARAGVADVELDALGAAGDLGLTAQRRELTPDLGEQVVQAVQVGLHALELADRALLAPPVLEDPGGLLDETAALLRRGMQDPVELALPDDHVHLPAQTRVREQLLDVQQAAGLAVDRVFGAAGAEQGARDRDLGVLDRQGAVGVVDRQGHVRPPQGRPARGAGEDHVLHLPAAQRLGALLAHDPGQGIDHVRLARPVRADDAGHPGLELEARGRGERLEAAHGEGLEMHPASLPGGGRRRRQPAPG